MVFHIGKSYIKHENGVPRLCADITFGDRQITIWFALEMGDESWLALGRADAFVVALLTVAMRKGHDITCDDPMSERLHYQLENVLVPSLAHAGELFNPIRINARLTTEVFPNQGAVGTGFSGGVDSLYTIMTHGNDSGMPLTHIAIFNSRAVYDKPIFDGMCRYGDTFVQGTGLGRAYLDTNLSQFKETYHEVYSIRNMACALALQGLFSVYLVSSAFNMSEFKFDLGHVQRYDPLTAFCASTESLAFYVPGSETVRAGKLEMLADWEPARKYLHPCTRTLLGEHNCGQCRKCCCDQTVLYALGKLDDYRDIFDVDDFLSHFSQRIGMLLAHEAEGNLDSTRALQILRNSSIQIPDAAYAHAKQVQRMRGLLRSKLEN